MVLLALLGAVPAAAQDPLPPVRINHRVTTVGHNITFSDVTYCGNSTGEDLQVSITVDGREADSFEPMPGSHYWWAWVDAPDQPGTYTYEVTCQGDGALVTYAPVEVRVLEPQPEGLSATMGEVTLDGCEVTLPVTTTGSYTYELQVWDNQTMLDSIVWDTQEDTTTVHTWTITGRPRRTFTDDIFFKVLINGIDTGARHSLTYSDELGDECSAATPVEAGLVEDASAVQPGQTVTIVGNGFLNGVLEKEDIDVTVDDSDTWIGGQKVIWPTRPFHGRDPFSVTATLPEDLAPGDHVLVLRGSASMRSVEIPITVVPPSTGSVG